MRTPQRNFVVEYKTRRLTQARPPSIWGNLDLQAVALQIEADGVLPDAARSDPNVPVNDPAPVAAIASSQEPQAAIEDHPQAPVCPTILRDADSVALKGLPQELPAIAASTAHDHHRTAGDAKSSDRSSIRSKRALIQEVTAADACFEISRLRDDEEDLVALDAENRRLKRLVIVRLRQENDRLRSMLRRFGAEQCNDLFE